MSDDGAELRRVLGQAIAASGRLRRDAERALGIRNGSLAQFLDGGDPKVEQLFALARLLRVPPADLLAAGAPATTAAARFRLADWLDLPAPEPAPEPTPDELDEAVRAAVQRELAARRQK
jgi:hypothetical protein